MDALTPGMTLIGYGAFKIGRNQGIKYEADYELPGDVEADRLLNGVLDLGVTYIDTAPAYGLSEERIGRFLSRRRSEFVLSTKVGEQFEDGRSRYDFSTKAIRASIEQSLRRLRTDVIDILFVHAPRSDAEVAASGILESLAQFRERGIVRAIGFSGHTAEAFRLSLAWADALMVEYHRGDPSLAPVIDEAAALGKIVVVKKGLASGRLPPEAAIRFVLANSGVTSLLISSLSLSRMAENVSVARNVRG